MQPFDLKRAQAGDKVVWADGGEFCAKVKWIAVDEDSAVVRFLGEGFAWSYTCFAVKTLRMAEEE
jgi:hypothetical protein